MSKRLHWKRISSLISFNSVISLIIAISSNILFHFLINDLAYSSISKWNVVDNLTLIFKESHKTFHTKLTNWNLYSTRLSWVTHDFLIRDAIAILMLTQLKCSRLLLNRICSDASSQSIDYLQDCIVALFVQSNLWNFCHEIHDYVDSMSFMNR
jgi:hypothetical protein